MGASPFSLSTSQPFNLRMHNVPSGIAGPPYSPGALLMARSIVLLFALLLSGAALAQETELRDAILDPMPVRDQFLLSNGLLSFEPEGPRVLEIGEWAFDLHHADSNTFSKSNWISHSLSTETRNQREQGATILADPRYQLRDSVFLIDGETHRVTLGLPRGP